MRMLGFSGGVCYHSHAELIRGGVMRPEFAEKLAPTAGFRNVLIREYLVVDWDEVYRKLWQLDDLYRFVVHVRDWLKEWASQGGVGEERDE